MSSWVLREPFRWQQVTVKLFCISRYEVAKPLPCLLTGSQFPKSGQMLERFSRCLAGNPSIGIVLCAAACFTQTFIPHPSPASLLIGSSRSYTSQAPTTTLACQSLNHDRLALLPGALVLASPPGRCDPFKTFLEIGSHYVTLTVLEPTM